MSKIYTVNGCLKPFHIKTEQTIFRKMLPKHNHTEKSINQLILDKQQIQGGLYLRNVVRIYSITDNYIDMELLDIDYKDKSNVMGDIYLALNQLHNCNIVYIDLKLDNIGYSHTDKCWKLFDFDASGIVRSGTKTEWLIHPVEHIAYKKYLDMMVENNCYNNLFALDTYAFIDLRKSIAQ